MSSGKLRSHERTSLESRGSTRPGTKQGIRELMLDPTTAENQEFKVALFCTFGNLPRQLDRFLEEVGMGY